MQENEINTDEGGRYISLVPPVNTPPRSINIRWDTREQRATSGRRCVLQAHAWSKVVYTNAVVIPNSRRERSKPTAQLDDANSTKLRASVYSFRRSRTFDLYAVVARRIPSATEWTRRDPTAPRPSGVERWNKMCDPVVVVVVVTCRVLNRSVVVEQRFWINGKIFLRL